MCPLDVEKAYNLTHLVQEHDERLDRMEPLLVDIHHKIIAGGGFFSGLKLGSYLTFLGIFMAASAIIMWLMGKITFKDMLSILS